MVRPPYGVLNVWPVVPCVACSVVIQTGVSFKAGVRCTRKMANSWKVMNFEWAVVDRYMHG